MKVEPWSLNDYTIGSFLISMEMAKETTLYLSLQIFITNALSGSIEYLIRYLSVIYIYALRIKQTALSCNKSFMYWLEFKIKMKHTSYQLFSQWCWLIIFFLCFKDRKYFYQTLVLWKCLHFTVYSNILNFNVHEWTH